MTETTDRGPATNDIARAAIAATDAALKKSGKKPAAGKATVQDELLDTLDVSAFSLTEGEATLTPEAIAARDTKRAEMAREVDKFIQAIPAWMDERVKRMQALFSLQGPERDLAEKEISAIKAEIERKCAVAHPLARKAAVLAYGGARVAHTPTIKIVVQKLGHDLASVGLLQPVEAETRGAVRVWEHYYTVHQDLASDQAGKILDQLEDLVQRTLRAGKEHYAGLVGDQKKQATGGLKVVDFYPGRKAGRFSLFAPNKEYKVRDEERVARGGQLLVESDGRRFWIKEAVGGCQNVVATRLGDRSLALETLENEELVLGKRVEKDLFGDLRILHSLVRQAWVHETHMAKEAERLATERADLIAKATVSPEDFFLGGKEGVVFVDYGPGTWRLLRAGKETFHKGVFFLAERRLMKKEPHVAVTAHSATHLQDFFSPGDTEFAPEGEKFEDLKQPLKGLLRWAFGQTVEAKRTREAREAREAEAPTSPAHGWDAESIAQLLDPASALKEAAVEIDK